MVSYVLGADASSWQGKYKIPAAEKFLFSKSTQGVNYFSPVHDFQVDYTRSKNKLPGHYHWLTPTSTPLAQAKFFVAKSKVKPGDILWCDWEQAGNTNAAKDQFIKYVQQMCPSNRVGLYCNVNWWLNNDHTGFVGDGLWIAAPGVNGQPTTRLPNIRAPWKIHQFSFVPHDLNHAAFSSLAEMKVWANSKRPASPIVIQPKPKPVPVPAPKPKPKPAPKPAPKPPEGPLEMTKSIYGRNLSHQSVARLKTKTLSPDKNDKGDNLLTLVFGPNSGVDVVAYVEVEGLPVGKVAELHWVIAQYDNDRKRKKDSLKYVRQVGTDIHGRGPNVGAHGSIVYKGSVPKPPKGFTNRLRLLMLAEAPCVVTSVEVTGWKM